MFERFTDQNRRVCVLAGEEARELGQTHLGSEHLLLGILREGNNIAAKSLQSLNISQDAARAKLKELKQESGLTVGAHLPFTTRAKKVLELSMREALQLGHSYIAPEHVLLALIRDGEGTAAQIITELGVDFLTLRRQTIQLLSSERDERRSVVHRSRAVIERDIEATEARLERLRAELAEAIDTEQGTSPG